jgi:hypothetical protein
VLDIKNKTLQKEISILEQRYICQLPARVVQSRLLYFSDPYSNLQLSLNRNVNHISRPASRPISFPNRANCPAYHSHQPAEPVSLFFSHLPCLRTNPRPRFNPQKLLSYHPLTPPFIDLDDHDPTGIHTHARGTYTHTKQKCPPPLTSGQHPYATSAGPPANVPPSSGPSPSAPLDQLCFPPSRLCESILVISIRRLSLRRILVSYNVSPKTRKGREYWEERERRRGWRKKKGQHRVRESRRGG